MKKSKLILVISIVLSLCYTTAFAQTDTITSLEVAQEALELTLEKAIEIIQI